MGVEGNFASNRTRLSLHVLAQNIAERVFFQSSSLMRRENVSTKHPTKAEVITVLPQRPLDMSSTLTKIHR